MGVATGARTGTAIRPERPPRTRGVARRPPPSESPDSRLGSRPGPPAGPRRRWRGPRRGGHPRGSRRPPRLRSGLRPAHVPTTSPAEPPGMATPPRGSPSAGSDPTISAIVTAIPGLACQAVAETFPHGSRTTRGRPGRTDTYQPAEKMSASHRRPGHGLQQPAIRHLPRS